MTHPDSFESWWNRSPWFDLKAEHSREETKAIAKQTARSAWLARGKADAEICEKNVHNDIKQHVTSANSYVMGCYDCQERIKELDHE